MTTTHHRCACGTVWTLPNAGSAADTGLRNVPSLLINGWTLDTGGVVLLRRVGPMCYCAFYAVKTPATWSGTATARLPAGFRPTQTGLGQGARAGAPVFVAANMATSNVAMTLNDFSSAGVKFFATGLTGASSVTGSAVSIIAECWYYTSDAWPSSLPGTPAIVGRLPKVG